MVRMKMIGKAFILFGLLSFFTGKALSQKVDRNEKSISYVVDASGLDKNTIHSYLFKSIALLYNDANNVIQINDRDTGIIILKGINEITIFLKCSVEINFIVVSENIIKIKPIKNVIIFNFE